MVALAGSSLRMAEKIDAVAAGLLRGDSIRRISRDLRCGRNLVRKVKASPVTLARCPDCGGKTELPCFACAVRNLPAPK